MWVAGHLTGGLGNRLFQHSAAAGLAEKWKCPLVFFLPRCQETGHGAFENIFKLFPEVPLQDQGSEWVTIREPPDHLYTYVPFGEGRTEMPAVVDGWRQTWKYFPSTGVNPNFENALGKVKLTSLEHYIPEPDKTWFLHVRLGDYKLLRHHYVNLEKYYPACLQQIPKGSRVILFSDEPELCKKSFEALCVTLNLEMLVTPTDDEVESLYLMSLCRGGAIIANSTFSWWGAWFAHQNGCKTVFYPSQWGAALPPPRDLIPSWGTCVDVDAPFTQ
jgi:hypothetical protein